MYFKKGKMDHAVVSGKAQSTYFYVKKDRTVSGKNEAAGDTINIVFDPLKNAVKTLRLLGRSTIASGRYVDLEKEQREKAAKEKADTTLTKLRGGNDKKERRKSSALRPSMNKMIKRAKETKRKEEESP